MDVTADTLCEQLLELGSRTVKLSTGDMTRTELIAEGATGARGASYAGFGLASGWAEQVPQVLLEEQFEVLGLIGVGGMGHVFRARHPSHPDDLAVKVIKPELLQNEVVLERFKLEIRAARKLRHPNIVSGLDVETRSGALLLVMEFLQGQKLSRLIRSRKTPLSIRHACHYARQVALGLAHAWESHLVHRDIKPSNLFVTDGQFVKIMDFGLAKFLRESSEGLESLTQEGEAFGTPDYIAPEQIRDARAADTRADIYALGGTLYFMLTGHKPFPEGSVAEKLVNHLEQDPRPMRELRKDIPADLEKIVGRMMRKDPGDRYQEPADVAVALEPHCRKR